MRGGASLSGLHDRVVAFQCVAEVIGIGRANLHDGASFIELDRIGGF
jgi:hypothetical protein